MLVLLFLGYPAISTKMLSVLNCREIHGAWYLQDGESVISVALAARRGCTATPTDARCSRGGWAVTDLRIECETPKHRLYQALGALGILLYPVRGARG